MILFASFLSTLAMIVDSVIWIVTIMIIAQAILSWVSPDPYNPIVRFINAVVDPILRPVRQRVPPVGPGIDLSPIIVLLVLQALSHFLVMALSGYARQIYLQAVG